MPPAPGWMAGWPAERSKWGRTGERTKARDHMGPRDDDAIGEGVVVGAGTTGSGPPGDDFTPAARIPGAISTGGRP